MNYIVVPGNEGSRHLRVYALSTCAFCERALEFLKKHELKHEYLFIDNIDPEVKRQLKAELKELYGTIPVFPVLIIDGKECVSGFTEENWRRQLGLS